MITHKDQVEVGDHIKVALKEGTLHAEVVKKG